FFFVFQAEDGIRDLTVTGVQTCALPISAAPWRRRVSHHVDEEQRRAQLFAGGGWVPVRIFPAEQLLPGLQALVRAAAGGISAARSEERRVGKECSCRWWP